MVVPERRRRRTVVLGFAFLAAALGSGWLCRQPILAGMAAGLIVDQPAEQADCALIDRGDRRYDVAAAMYRRWPQLRILVLEEKPERIVRDGIVPSWFQIARRELGTRGVPEEAVELIAGGARTPWESAHILDGWLREHPDQRVVMLCERFDTRKYRIVLDASLGPQQATRVLLRGLPDRRYDERTWWRSRVGLRSFVLAWIHILHVALVGEHPAYESGWDPGRYERKLKARQSPREPDR